jgi:hypothetical protein
VAAFAAAAFFQEARASANAAWPAGGGVGGGVGDTACPVVSPVVTDGDPAGVVAPVSAGVAEVDAAPVTCAACRVPGAAAGLLALAAPHAVTVKIVASSTPATGRNRSLVMSGVTRDLGVWLGLVPLFLQPVFGNGENDKIARPSL